MKHLLFLAICSSILFASCQRTSDDIVTPSTGAVAGNWKVAYYWDKKNETSNFTGWSFRFLADGKAEAVNGATTIAGTWLKTSTKFSINFNSDALLSKLSSEWLIVSFTDNSIKLKDDNPLQDDELHLER
jgi:hypothetical protein